VEAKVNSPKSKPSASSPVHTENQFATLEDENIPSMTEPESSGNEEVKASISSQIKNYRSKETSRFNNSTKKHSLLNKKTKFILILM
jgi:hypothetical protein